MTAVRRIRNFDPGRAPFEAWLRGVADNVLRNHYRRARLRSSVERPVSDAALLGPAAASGAPPVDGRASELAERIALTLTELPRRYQEVLKAKYEEHLPVAEIAGLWGQGPKAVESLLTRARAAFRETYRRISGPS